MNDIVLRMHYHDNDGLPDQLEVVEAPATAKCSLDFLMRQPWGRYELWWNDTFVFGTPGLGEGRVAYRVAVWDEAGRCLRIDRVWEPLPCCDLHNHNCEPPSELCCVDCTEAHHPQHADGGRCVLAARQATS